MAAVEWLGPGTHGQPAAVAGGTPFVGRRSEVALLDTLLADAVGGRGALVLVLGEPGIGKTRLAEEVGRRATACGFDVHWGRCHDAGAQGLWPWIPLLAGCLRGERRQRADAPAPDETVLLDLAPELRRATAGAESALGPPERARLFAAVAALLRRRASRQPLLLVLDDLQWAAAPTVRLLEFVARELGDAPVLLLATCRDTEVDAASPPAQLLGLGVARSCALGGLGEADVARLVSAGTGRQPSASLLAAVMRATGGNPFFVGEVAHLLGEEGRLDASGALPASVREVVRRRVGRLSPAARDLLAVAAVAGREFELRVVAAALGGSRPRTVDAAAEAMQARLLRRAEGAGASGRHEFVHAVVRTALYEALPAARRAALHDRVGCAIERAYARDLAPHQAALAAHFAHVPGPRAARRVLAYEVAAGRSAARAFAYEDAVRHLRSAAERLDSDAGATPVRGLELLLELGEAEVRAGDVPAGRATFLRAAALARDAGDADALARAALGLGRGWAWGVGAGLDDPELIALLEESAAAVGGGDGPARALLLARLAVAYYWSVPRRRSADGAPLAEEAVAVARRLGDARVLLGTLAARHWVDVDPGAVEARLAVATEVVGIACGVGDDEALLLGRAMRIVDLLELGDLAAAAEEVARYEHLAARLRHPAGRLYATAFRGMLAFVRGDLDAAEGLAGELLAIGERVGDDELALALWAGQLFALRREQGRIGELRPLVEAAAERATAADHVSAFAWRTGAAWLLGETGEEAAARASFAPLMARGLDDVPRDAHRGVVLCLLGEIAVRLHDVEAAGVVYERLLPYAGRNLVGPFGAMVYGAADRCLGLLAAVLGRRDDAARHMTAALALHARMGAPLLVARTEREGAGIGGVAEALRVASPGAPRPVRAALRHEGECWMLEFEDRRVVLRDGRGLRYLARLLRQPGRPVHALDLLAETRVGGAGADPGLEERRRLRSRLADAREERDEAERDHDLGRAADARARVASLSEELLGALDARARRRGPGSPAERARLLVTQRLKALVKRIGSHDATLGRHLAGHVRTGYLCVYEPDPGRPIVWTVSAPHA